MTKKTRKKGLRHQDRVMLSKGNGGKKDLPLDRAGKTRRLTGPPIDRRKRSKRRRS